MWLAKIVISLGRDAFNSPTCLGNRFAVHDFHLSLPAWLQGSAAVLLW